MGTIMNRFDRGGLRRAGTAAAAVALAALALAACNNGDILQVQEPDIVTPASLGGPAGLNARYTGAIGDFVLGYAGGIGNGSYADNVTTMSALMSDEGFLSDTYPTRQEFDQRSIDVKNSSLQDAFSILERARASLESAAAALSAAQGGATDSRVGELQALDGFAYVSFAELYCSGVPFSSVAANGALVYGQQQTTAQMLTAAIARFDSAIGHANGDANITNLARVGKARAQLDAGDFAGAAATAAPVPTSFAYQLFPSIKGVVPLSSIETYNLENGYYSGQTSERRISVSDVEGGTGLPFRSANDPRVPFAQDPNGGFDSTSPQYDFTTYATTGINLGREAPVPLATGTEARLIEAEAALHAGDAAGSLAILNTLRQGAALAPLSDQGAAADVLQLFSERAFWLYATGHRLGDLRRLVRQYGMPANSVFPSGAYFKGGDYGNDVNYPVPFIEQNNPNFKGCLDRNP